MAKTLSPAAIRAIYPRDRNSRCIFCDLLQAECQCDLFRLCKEHGRWPEVPVRTYAECAVDGYRCRPPRRPVGMIEAAELVPPTTPPPPTAEATEFEKEESVRQYMAKFFGGRDGHTPEEQFRFESKICRGQCILLRSWSYDFCNRRTGKRFRSRETFRDRTELLYHLQEMCGPSLREVTDDGTPFERWIHEPLPARTPKPLKEPKEPKVRPLKEPKVRKPRKISPAKAARRAQLYGEGVEPAKVATERVAASAANKHLFLRVPRK